MSRYADNVFDKLTGRPIPDVDVYVYTQAGTLAVLRDQANLLITNPVRTDQDGAFSFYTDDGLYSAEFIRGGKTLYIDEQIIVGGGVPLPNEIVTALGAANGASLIGESGGGNVQTALNARVKTSDLALPSASATLGFSHTPAATSGTIADKLKRQVLVTDAPFGADSTGVTTANAALAAAIATGKRVTLPKGTYRFDSQFDGTGANDVTLHFEEGAVLDFTNMASLAPAMILGGTVGANLPLSANVAKGATAITVTGHTLVAGDHFRITSTDLWNPIRPEYTKGEQCIVRSVAGNTITLMQPLEDSYLAATSAVAKYSSGRVTLTGRVEIKRTGNSEGLRVQYTRNPQLDSIRVTGAQERGIYLLECYEPVVNNGYAFASYPAGGGTNYGLAVCSCVRARVRGGYFYGGRHGITTGGTFPDRDLIFENVITDCDDAGGQSSFDTHSNGERIRLINCIALNGFHGFSKDTTIEGGTYVSRSLAKGPIVWEFDSVNSGQFVCEPDLAVNKAGLVAIWAKGGINNAGADFIRIAPQKVRTLLPSVANAAGLISAQAGTVGNICIVPRTEIQCGDAIVESTPTISVYGVAVGAQSDWRGEIVMSGRFGDARDKVRSAYLKTTGKIVSQNSRFVGSDVGNNLVDHEGGDWDSFADIFNGGPAAVSRCVSSSSTGRIHFHNPSFVNLITNGGFEATASTDVLISNPKSTGCTGSFTATATHIKSDVGHLGQATLYTAAIPTFTHFPDGSVSYPTNPAVASPGSWLKVAGTWRAQGNVL